MIRLRISVFHEVWRQEITALPTRTPGHHAIWIQSGNITLAGKAMGANQGFYIDSTNFTACFTDMAQIVRFTVEADTNTAPTSSSYSKLLLSSALTAQEQNGILRLDRVTFPAGATAYRHTHAGAGIRYLTRGRLQVIADDHSKTMEPGQAWFEDAYSPVKAIAAPEGVTEFIRVMVLPTEFAGKPTLKLLNPEDEAKPKLQTNYRYFDQHLNLSA